MTTPAPTVIWRPHPGPQCYLITCPIEDILCGGARGGGKTQGMIGCWLQHQAQYGKHARGVWFRRSLPEIEGAQVEMLKVFPAIGAVYEVQARTWAFPSGARLKLRYLESDADAYRYVGHEYSLLLFDDAGTWPSPTPIDLLRGTLRSAFGVPCRMILSANPCGAGHEWLKERYVSPAPPLTVHVADGIRRVFIPSTIKDNPSIAGEARERYLAQLRLSGPAHIVAAWIDGDWDVEPGGAMLDAEWLAIRYDEPPNLATRIRRPRVVLSVDPAEDVGSDNDETGIVCGALNGYHCDLLHAEAVKMLLDPLEARLALLCLAFNPELVVVEKKSVGGPLVQNLKRRPGWRWPVQAIDPGQLSKAERLWEQAPWFQGGRVRLPSAKAQALLPFVAAPPKPGTSDWSDYVREMVRFTGNRKRKERDNRVDATSQLLRNLQGASMAGLLSA